MRISDWSSDVCSSDLTPRTHGKAERFIHTVLRECAYARPFRSSSQRAGALAPWTDDYNTLRPHTALAHQPPFAKLKNLLGNDTSRRAFEVFSGPWTFPPCPKIGRASCRERVCQYV